VGVLDPAPEVGHVDVARPLGPGIDVDGFGAQRGGGPVEHAGLGQRRVGHEEKGGEGGEEENEATHHRGIYPRAPGAIPRAQGPAAGVPGGWKTPGTAAGLATQTSPSKPSGSRKNRLRMGPKSVTKPSDAPRSISRSRMVWKASREAACRPRWSMRPRPNIGVWRAASSLPSTWNTLSWVWGPMSTKDRRMASPSGAPPSRETVASKTSTWTRC